MSDVQSIGVVGARGYVGGELLQIIQGHSNFECVFACSSSQAGSLVSDHVENFNGDLVFEDLTPDQAADREPDAIVLCLPDGQSEKWVAAFAKKQIIVLDVGSDYRFDDEWTYRLTEHNRAAIKTAKRISNPGCYATACQLALWPVVNLLSRPPSCFGVSGYSGAGRTPGPRNDPELLAGGISPYKLVNHTHEREVSRHLAHPVRFSPHVAPFFRGISVTVQAQLKSETTISQLFDLYQKAYSDSRAVLVTAEIPRVQEVVNFDGAVIGGINVNPERPDEFAIVCTIDNLRKGAAGQAIQNLNLALAVEEFAGLELLQNDSAKKPRLI